MNKELLPYLSSLSDLLKSAANSSTDNEVVSMHIDLSKRLVDLMFVQNELSLLLEEKCLNKIPEVVVKLEKVLPKSKNSNSLLRELNDISDLGSENCYEQFLKCAEKIQRELIKHKTSKAINLSKLLLRMETEYSQNFFQAILDQNNLTPRDSESSSARNIRAFNKKDLINFIQKKFPKETNIEIRNTSFVTGGYSKYTVDISLDKTLSLPKNIILRGDAGDGFGGMSVVDEYSLINDIFDNGVCAPKPIAVDKNKKIFGSPFMLMEKMSGACIGHMFDIPPISSNALVEDIAKKLSSIHLIPINKLNKSIDGVDCTSSDKALRWISSSEASWLELNLPSQVFSAAFEWLRLNAKIYDNGSRSLVHGDYGINNLLIKDEKVLGILDWEHAHIGNPAYDLGYFHPMADKLASWSVFLDAYADTGAPMPSQDQIDYSILLGATRVGVMVCQVRSAFLKNQETGIAASIGIAGDYYDMAIIRISNALETVL